MGLINGIEHIDKEITLFVNSFHFMYGDMFWQALSDVQIWIPLYLAIIVMLYIRLGAREASIIVVSIVLTVLACDQFANLIKDSVERLRPCYDNFMVNNNLNILEKRTGYFGFFSAHSANAFGTAICSSNGFKNDESHKYNKYKWLIFTWAFLVGLSRIFVGKHFLGDVITGAAVGLAFGFVFSKIGQIAIRKTAKAL